MSGIWNSILDALESLLDFLHTGLEVPFGVHSWGWSIIALTIIVRLVLLPLAIKQTRSMRGMQELSPKLKAIQKKYPTDRDMLRTDPEKYRARKAKVNEETMALYREAGVNPAAGCLPLVAQMPIFFALFSLLRDSDLVAEQPFYFFTDFIEAGSAIPQGLGANGSDAGWPAILLIVMMGITMFVTQKQMMGRNPQTEGMQAQQQKILLYVMPVMLAFFGFNLPLGVLLYWVTTNLWQMVQQYIVYRDLGPAPSMNDDAPGGGPGSTRTAPAKDPGAKDANPKRDRSGRAKGSSKQPPAKPAKKRGSPPSSNGRADRGTANGKADRSSSPPPGKRRRGSKPDDGPSSPHLPGKKKRS